MTSAATLEIAVIVTDSAISPRARCVSRFAIAPPGEAPSSTSPTASSGSRPNSSAIANASSGEITSRFTSPMPTPFGDDEHPPEVRRRQRQPETVMITARQTGSSTSVVNTPAI